MALLERASKSKQILLKHYSLKINRLRETERKELRNLGSSQFLIGYNYKNILLLTFIIFFILFH